MTINGGQPHAVGDKGQQFEVTFYDPGVGGRRVFGWSDTPEGAFRMASAIELHPSWSSAQIKDRRQARDFD